MDGTAQMAGGNSADTSSITDHLSFFQGTRVSPSDLSPLNAQTRRLKQTWNVCRNEGPAEHVTEGMVT